MCTKTRFIMDWLRLQISIRGVRRAGTNASHHNRWYEAFIVLNSSRSAPWMSFNHWQIGSARKRQSDAAVQDAKRFSVRFWRARDVGGRMLGAKGEAAIREPLI